MRVFPNLYTQTDPRWATDKLGTGGDTNEIGGDGCFLTSLAIKAGYYGHVITPDVLDNAFRSLNLSTDPMGNDNLAHQFQDVRYVATYDYSGGAPDLALLKQLSDDDTMSVTIRIGYQNPGWGNHFMELQSYDGKTLLLADPMANSMVNGVKAPQGVIIEFYKKYTGALAAAIQEYIVYSGKPAPVPVTAATFSAHPQVTPLRFYAEPNVTHHLYDSAATKETTLKFDAWTYGLPVLDPVANQYDRRWYRRHNPGGQAGWTASAWVDNNPTPSAP